MVLLMMTTTMMLLVVEGVVHNADDDVDGHDDDDDGEDDDHDVILNIVSRDVASIAAFSALAAATRTHICGCRMAWLRTHLSLGPGRSCSAWKALNDNLKGQT